ncbi:hypothetical protein SEPCBS57363_002101 [Sporothrix epigloea]|uniref:Uncharacterized protein n=1 Tax=Sporothrix epigloea TaxID=1892477 RepID=A0ABP0DDZ8_9PEZI
MVEVLDVPDAVAVLAPAPAASSSAVAPLLLHNIAAGLHMTGFESRNQSRRVHTIAAIFLKVVSALPQEDGCEIASLVHNLSQWRQP